MEYNIQNSDELTHWGIKGMRWGVRRYQNKDGSLTPAGKKHRAAEESKLKERERIIKNREQAKARQAKTAAKKAELDAREKALDNKNIKNAAKPKTKTAAEMTDDEIKDRINRMLLEKQYYDTKRSLAASNPQQVSRGKKFMDSVLNDVVAPAAKEAGRKWLTNFMEDKLGLNKKTELQRLEDTWKKLDYKKKISDLQKGINDNDDDKELSKLTRKRDLLKLEKEIDDYKNPKDDDGKELSKLTKERDLLKVKKEIDDYKNPKDDDPYGLKEAEGKAKRAKADYEEADYNYKKGNVGKDKPEKPDWESAKKEQEYVKNRYNTEKARRSWDKYVEDIAKLGPEKAWEEYVKREEKSGS